MALVCTGGNGELLMPNIALLALQHPGPGPRLCPLSPAHSTRPCPHLELRGEIIALDAERLLLAPTLLQLLPQCQRLLPQ